MSRRRITKGWIRDFLQRDWSSFINKSFFPYNDLSINDTNKLTMYRCIKEIRTILRYRSESTSRIILNFDTPSRLNRRWSNYQHRCLILRHRLSRPLTTQQIHLWRTTFRKQRFHFHETQSGRWERNAHQRIRTSSKLVKRDPFYEGWQERG